MSDTFLSFLPSSTTLTEVLSFNDGQGEHRFAVADLTAAPGGWSAFRGQWKLEIAVGRLLTPATTGLAPGVPVRTASVAFSLTNVSGQPRTVDWWRALALTVSGQQTGPGGHDLWAYCGASHEERPDWLRPVDEGFAESGWLGMNASDYGGGNPVSAVWNSADAVALGCLSPVPEVLGFPLNRPSGPAQMSVGWSSQQAGRAGPLVAAGHRLDLPLLWVATTPGDGLCLLASWRLAMEEAGLPRPSPSPDSRQPTWCAWGYERDFTLKQVTRALPKVAELGFGWFTLDDGWQSEEGDITLNPAKFPGGEAQMRAFVDEIHGSGLKAMLWWIPLAADPQSRWAAEHADTLVRDPAGRAVDITWWDSALLCPSHPDVVAETRRQLRKFFVDWGFDGLKIDGQHLNAIPACHDPSHGHTDPEEPHRRLPEFWRLVQTTAREFRPGATVLFCPCGTTYNLHSMPYYDMPVASDPSGSWQVRTKGAVFKALMGPQCAFHGDHIELSDRERDYASTVGIGGILDTKFTWPPGSSNPSVLKPGGNFDLLPADEARMRAWLSAFRTEALDTAVYTLGSYRFGFEPVEVHVLDAGNRWYYSCFALPGPGQDSLDARWSGRLELRGLPAGPWRVTVWAEGADVADQDKGVLASTHLIDLDVTGSMLLRLDKVNEDFTREHP